MTRSQTSVEALPALKTAFREAKKCAAQITLGRSAFLRAYGCASEAQYKRQCMQEGRIMYHAHIGLNDWPETERVLVQLCGDMAAQGHRLDRVGLALDRRMGLPASMRHQAAAETGPLLTHPEQWQRVAQCAMVQPHMGDFMIGMPASVENTCLALQAGVTTIGNLSQYFAFETPMWRDAKHTALATTTAIALLGHYRAQGVMLHSYLEDGFAALFQDCQTIAAWAYMERYIVEELLGAKLSHCIGGLTSDPIRRAGWVFALDKIHRGESIGSMIYGDTISFTQDFEQNRALVSEYLLWDILAQLHRPTGHAVLPLPVTEAVRIPSVDEIFDAQRLGRRIEESARRLYPHVDFSASEAFAETVCREGEVRFQRALSALQEEGVDIRDPLRLLYLLKQRGAQWFENTVCEMTEQTSPALPTDIYRLSLSLLAEQKHHFDNPAAYEKLAGRRLLLASTDVHAHAIHALAALLRLAGAEVINLGAEQSAPQVAEAVAEERPDALLLSTHNGMALSYAEQLLAHWPGRHQCPILMGGVLNQKVDDQALPIAVTRELKALGVQPVVQVDALLKTLPSAAQRLPNA